MERRESLDRVVTGLQKTRISIAAIEPSLQRYFSDADEPFDVPMDITSLTFLFKLHALVSRFADEYFFHLARKTLHQHHDNSGEGHEICSRGRREKPGEHEGFPHRPHLICNKSQPRPVTNTQENPWIDQPREIYGHCEHRTQTRSTVRYQSADIASTYTTPAPHQPDRRRESSIKGARRPIFITRDAPVCKWPQTSPALIPCLYSIGWVV